MTEPDAWPYLICAATTATIVAAIAVAVRTAVRAFKTLAGGTA